MWPGCDVCCCWQLTTLTSVQAFAAVRVRDFALKISVGIAEGNSAYCDMFPYRGLSVCRLSHSCTLLKPLDGMSCHLVGTVVWSELTLYLDRGSGSPREGEIWGRNPQLTTMLPIAKLRWPLFHYSKHTLQHSKNREHSLERRPLRSLPVTVIKEY